MPRWRSCGGRRPLRISIPRWPRPGMIGVMTGSLGAWLDGWLVRAHFLRLCADWEGALSCCVVRLHGGALSGSVMHHVECVCHRPGLVSERTCVSAVYSLYCCIAAPHCSNFPTKLLTCLKQPASATVKFPLPQYSSESKGRVWQQGDGQRAKVDGLQQSRGQSSAPVVVHMHSAQCCRC